MRNHSYQQQTIKNNQKHQQTTSTKNRQQNNWHHLKQFAKKGSKAPIVPRSPHGHLGEWPQRPSRWTAAPRPAGAPRGLGLAMENHDGDALSFCVFFVSFIYLFKHVLEKKNMCLQQDPSCPSFFRWHYKLLIDDNGYVMCCVHLPIQKPTFHGLNFRGAGTVSTRHGFAPGNHWAIVLTPSSQGRLCLANRNSATQHPTQQRRRKRRVGYDGPSWGVISSCFLGFYMFLLQELLNLRSCGDTLRMLKTPEVLW